MRCLILTITLLATAALAQNSTPKVEVGMGYSYSPMRVPNSTSRANMHGVLVTATTNVNPWFGVEAEFGTHYHCIAGCWSPWGDRLSGDLRNDSLSFMAGPKFTLSRRHRVEPWVHVLGGAGRVTYDDHLTETRMSTSGGAFAAGGGLDVPFSRFSVRAFQVDYLRMPVAGATGNVRFNVGFLVRFGQRAVAK